MHKALNEFVNDMDNPDNPVKDFLGIKHIIKDEQRKKEILTNIDLIKNLQHKYVKNVTSLIITIFKWEKDEKASTLYLSFGVEPILNRMVNLGESIELISFLQNLKRDQEVINHNENIMKVEVNRAKDIKKTEDIPCYFSDKDYTPPQSLDKN